ncbi:MAG TPA: ribonuclease P protein component [Candidatus Dormibacteraeota bacterium]|nr:ribonuclease P protein component [Candidatus Dormibacteraeota bacterium]
MGARSLLDAARKGGGASPPSDYPRSSPPAGPNDRLLYPRSCRLLRRKDFDAAYRSGKRRSGARFVVFCRQNELGRNRFGTSVGRRIGGAVKRGRVRRRVREIVRLHRQEFAPGWDIVIQPRITAVQAPYASLEKELVALIRSLTSSPI